MFRSRSKHGMIYYEDSIRSALSYSRERFVYFWSVINP